MNLTDYKIHVQKNSHMDKVSEHQQMSLQTNEFDADTLDDVTASFTSCSESREISENDEVCDDDSDENSIQEMDQDSDNVFKSIESATSRSITEILSGSEAIEQPIKKVQVLELKNIIETDKVLPAMLLGAIDLVSRTENRIQNEMEIMRSLECYLKALDSSLKMVAFGSATFGFGGSNTNLNILVDAGNFCTAVCIGRIIFFT